MGTAAQSGIRERRRSVRYEFDARITINSHDREGEAAIWGRCSDLSEEGLGRNYCRLTQSWRDAAHTTSLTSPRTTSELAGYSSVSKWIPLRFRAPHHEHRFS